MNNIKHYFKHIVYYFLAFTESFLNLLCCFFGFYPCLDYANSFLIYFESIRINLEMDNRKEQKLDMREEAKYKAQEARVLEE
jgi:hypothetical protein